MMGKCRILSPAGSYDLVEACIFSGADCIYLAADKFNARGYAKNFSYDEIKHTVDFAHEYNVRVYVTVNIAIFNDEIIDALDYVYFLYTSGVDGVIIADIGLGALVSKLLPDFELHASTQMTIYDYSFVKWLVNNGYSSVNLSREVALPQIKWINTKLKEDNLDVNLEVFAHGSLCYAYSGRCLMSSFLGGRSGNRGLCAQPCRMRYSIADDNKIIQDDDYLLSTHDLCTFNHIDTIKKSGVGTLKIEGRMKSREYIIATTYAYQRAVNGKATSEDLLLLNLAFNRGFTSGYLMENTSDDVVSRKRSGAKGYLIGEVDKYYKDKLSIRLTCEYPVHLVNGDGIKFEQEGVQDSGMYISNILRANENEVVIKVDKKLKIKHGAQVYITYSKYLEDKTKQIVNERHIHPIDLDLELTVTDDLHLKVDAECLVLNEPVEYLSKEAFEEARNKPLRRDVIAKQFKKTGNTQFKINHVKFNNYDDDLFMSIGSVNNIRRELLEKIEKLIRDSYKPTQNNLKDAKRRIHDFMDEYFDNLENDVSPHGVEFNVYISTPSQVLDVEKYSFVTSVTYDASFNYENIDLYFKNIKSDLKKVMKNTSKEVVWQLPSLLRDVDISKVNEVLEDVDVRVLTDNIGVASEVNADVWLHDMNVVNNYTVKKLTSDISRIKNITLSCELSYDNLKTFEENNSCSLEYLIFSTPTLIITKDNMQNITENRKSDNNYMIDENKNHYPIHNDVYNHIHIHDYRVINLIDEINVFKKIATSKLGVDLRFHKKHTTKILNQIKNSLENTQEKQEELKTYEGNFKKGVYEK